MYHDNGIPLLIILELINSEPDPNVNVHVQFIVIRRTLARIQINVAVLIDARTSTSQTAYIIVHRRNRCLSPAIPPAVVTVPETFHSFANGRR